MAKIIVLKSDRIKDLLQELPLFEEKNLAKLLAFLTYDVFSHFKALDIFKEKKVEPLLEICLQDKEEIAYLNQVTRGKETATDVLSFPEWNFEKALLPLSERKEMDEILKQNPSFYEEGILLGSLSICVPVLKEQAFQYGHSLGRELSFLVLHSFLHLLGFDHLQEKDKEEMEELQNFFMEKWAFSRDLEEDAFMEKLDKLQLSHEASQFFYEEEKVESFLEQAEDGEKIDYSDLLSDFSEEISTDEEEVHTGFLCIVGRANAGKSTLLNRLSGENIAIVSRKAQTTRHNIRAIVDQEDAQFIFTDTPGLHKAETRLGQFMMESAFQGLENADLLLLLVDACKIKKTEFEELCLAKAKEFNKKVIVVFNKCDLVKKESLLPFIEAYAKEEQVLSVFPLSAQTGQGISALLEYLKSLLPKGKRVFPKGSFTDQSERQLASEYIREQILKYCHEEIPHGTAVLIDKFEEVGTEEEIALQERKLIRIFASILCEKENHKGILIGKKGENLKRMATEARKKMEKMLGSKVYLELHVKVRENWRNRPVFLKDLGYEQKK